MHFRLLHADNNSILVNNDIAHVAKRVAAYRNESPDAEERYFKTLQSVTLAEERGVEEKEFIENARKFVFQPNVVECVRELADMVFGMVGDNKNGIISYDEYSQFYRAINANQKLIDTFFKRADTNEDSIIDRSEIRESYVNYFFSG